MPDKVCDKLGQEILPGDYICYAVRQGNSAKMKIGKVIRVEIDFQTSPFSPEKQLLAQRIIVRGVDEWWNPPRLNKKNGTLTDPDRIVVLPESRVPETYLGLLRGVE